MGEINVSNVQGITFLNIDLCELLSLRSKIIYNDNVLIEIFIPNMTHIYTDINIYITK